MKSCDYCYSVIDETELIEHGGHYFCSEKCYNLFKKENEIDDLEEGYQYKEDDSYMDDDEEEWIDEEGDLDDEDEDDYGDFDYDDEDDRYN